VNVSEIIAALDLPAGSRVDRRVPKKLLLENGAPTAADKRHINDGIEELWWIAALKPTTVSVPEYRDDVREYLEIATLHLMIRPGARAHRLVELVHRAVPYPVLLLTDGERTGVSTAHKRWAQNEAGKVVLDGELVAVEWDETQDGPQRAAFCEGVALRRQPRTTLLALYQGWMNAIIALKAARETGKFAIAASTEQADTRRSALLECSRLDTEIARLHAAAAKERQMARQVELNLELKRLEAARAVSRAKL
jgi:hypothetical protein